jgi:lipocalin
MKTKIIGIILALIIVSFTSVAFYIHKTPKSQSMKTVENVDINRYLGTWYEIARYPHKFERKLQGVTATYSMREDGKIDVLNQGYKNGLNGKLKKAKGKARIPNAAITGHLEVSFFLNFYADYYILELDTINYQYALIGSSTPNYLWILSRTPQMDEHTYQMLIDKAIERGYDLNKIEKVAQAMK